MIAIQKRKRKFRQSIYITSLWTKACRFLNNRLHRIKTFKLRFCRAGAAEFIFKRASFTAVPDNMTEPALGPQAKKRKQASTDPEPGKNIILGYIVPGA